MSLFGTHTMMIVMVIRFIIMSACSSSASFHYHHLHHLVRSDVDSEGQARGVVKFGAISRLAPVPLQHHMNAVRFCWALCALLALHGNCVDILRTQTQRNVRLLCTLCGSARRKQEQMAAADHHMVTSKPAESCLAGPLALARLRCHSHHQCL